ncbi:MAG: transcriptional regulator [Thermoprotei archaeon]|nr:MAG: transcriptional regulator [Thermoprotei archaeon]
MADLESRRERIIRLLSSTREPLDAQQIARELGLSPREARLIYEDLMHIARSLRNGPLTLYMVPPTCKSCGYVFKDLKRLRRPSRCPRCKSQRISPPRFLISAEKL